MTISTRLQPRYRFWMALYTFMCLAFGLWGAYDYWVKYPALEASARDYTRLKNRQDELAAAAKSRTLSDDETKEYEAAKGRLTAEFAEPPTPPSGFDKPFQLWGYVIGCGVVGFPWCAWMLVAASRKRWTLHEDGSLDTPEGTIPAERVADIDMDRWMSKSIAVVKDADGREYPLDDYKWKNTDKIVVELCRRFHPGQWTDEARPVDEGKDSDDSKGVESGEAPTMEVSR